ncbi:MAG: hypothetical protein J6S06_01900 [Alphaproteobacteria bacterium]|nr:hypothetical protein [Alphaproteobacteria bacterium]MBR5575468.1 hypothetical protein [Alphaproteobacteria bacterium]
MKKILALLSVLALAVSCGGLVESKSGTQFLTQLDAEPIGCTFLYKLESEVSVYDADDARRYLENRIVDQARPGNAYWITSQRTRPNEWVIFGPERTFVFVANVYDCPNPQKIRTAKDGGPETVSVLAPGVVDGDAKVYPVPTWDMATPQPNAKPCGQVMYGQLVECY